MKFTKKPETQIILPLVLFLVLKNDGLRGQVRYSSTTACYYVEIQSCHLAPSQPVVSKGNLIWTLLLLIYHDT